MAIDKKGLRLAVEIGTPLTLEAPGFGNRISCFVIGMKPEDFIIVNMPRMDANKSLSDGMQCLVRYLYFGNIYRFESTILKYLTKPARVLFLSYPETIATHNMRKNKRINCCIPAVANVSDFEIQGVIADISTDGCKFIMKMSESVAKSVVKKDDKLNVLFALQGMSEPESVQAIISHLLNDGEKTLLGLNFIALSESFLAKINEYVEKE